MSTLADRLAADLNSAMKRKETSVVDSLRMFRAAIKYAEIDKGHVLNDEEVMQVARTMVKQLRDAIEQFREGKREDLIAKSENELKILSTYLPPELSDEELAILVVNTITVLGATSQKDIGRVMGAVVKEVGGRADGSRINQIVRSHLSS